MAEDTAEVPVQAARRVVIPRAEAATVAGVGIAAVAASSLWTTHAVQHGPQLCPLRALTGLPCPGCGLTRSWVFAAHGDLASAFGFNAFGPVFFAVLLVAALVAGWTLISGRRGGWDRMRSVVVGPVGIVLIVAWLGYGVVRIVDGIAGWGLFPTVT